MSETICVCCGQPVGDAAEWVIDHIGAADFIGQACAACLMWSVESGESVVTLARQRRERDAVGIDALRAWGVLRVTWLARAEEER